MTTPYRWVMTGVGQPFEKVAFELTPVQPGEVIVEVAGCGVCHTDLGFIYDGVKTNHTLPLALGHEISGRVIAAGTGCEALMNKAVIIPAVIPCDECDLCRRGHQTICRNQKMPGNDIHGGFATHISVPGHCLCEVDEAKLARVGLELADVSVVADAVTTPFQAAAQAGIEPGDLAIVIGVGGVGGYAVQIASAMGATVIAIDIDQSKLDALRDHGAALTLNARDYDTRALKKAVSAFAKEQGLRSTEWKIFECSGSAPGQTNAFGLLTFGATLAVVGFTLAKLELRLSNLMAFHAKAQGNWGCAPAYYPDALAMVMEGKIAMKPFTRQYPLDDINQIFADAQAHKLSARAILVP